MAETPPPTLPKAAPAAAPARPKKRELPAWARDKDWGLLVLLLLLNLRSAYTTVLGARQLLPYPMSDVLGIAIQAMLFLVLAGFALRDVFVRKWTLVVVFSVACIYASFFTYYDELAKNADDRRQLDVALQQHAELVSAIYQPARSRIDGLNREADAMFELAERESQRGSSSGVSGYGPVAKKYAAEAGQKKIEAQGLQADLDRLQPHFEYTVDGLTSEEVYRKDLEAWQLSPSDWKAGIAMPTRAEYVDMNAQVALLAPIQRVREGDTPAIVALALAALVDGIAIFLGSAVEIRQRKLSFSEQIAKFIASTKNSTAVVKAAIEKRGVVDARQEESLLDDALQVVDLRIAGRGSDFLSTFYQAIHPETGALDFSGLQRHPNATYRIAARMLVDQLRNPKLGWITVDEGWWAVPEEVYPHVTAWLGEHIRRECEAEADGVDADRVKEPERTLRLVIPAAS
ncbi:MAG: hypothetical protein ABMA64_24090 [Myxococcota bacterium]